MLRATSCLRAAKRAPKRLTNLDDISGALRAHENAGILRACGAPRWFPTSHVHSIGCDEVGTGAIAGPIVAVAAYVPPHIILQGAADSKLLSSQELLNVYGCLQTEKGIVYHCCVTEAESINEVGAGLAIDDALATALTRTLPKVASAIDDGYALDIPFANRRIVDRCFEEERGSVPILGCVIDGERVPFGAYGSHSACAAITAMPGADRSCMSVAAASIIAKVLRDAEMVELDAQYPEYGFADHKGYATERHLEAIRRLGPCPAHRVGAASLPLPRRSIYPSAALGDATASAPAAAPSSLDDLNFAAAKAVLSAISAARISAKRLAVRSAKAAASAQPAAASTGRPSPSRTRGAGAKPQL